MAVVQSGREIGDEGGWLLRRSQPTVEPAIMPLLMLTFVEVGDESTIAMRGDMLGS